MQPSPRAAPGRVPVVWRKRLLVDEATRLPLLLPPEPESAPFVALDARHDGLAQVAEELEGRAARFVDPAFEFGRYEPALRAAVVRALATARWSEETQYCARCARPLRWEPGELAKSCDDPDGSHRHFPRIDPAAIVLVDDGERMLLGRQPNWPPGMYSTLAGFVEAGESAEEAVVREVFEESGVRVGDVRYFGSEPWPFPRSLMFGFFARARSNAIVRGAELEDVRWFDAGAGRALLATLEAAMPYGDTIARRLIAAWLAARA